MALAFNTDKLSRTTTRAQWREMDRWRRRASKAMKAEFERQLMNLHCFGTTHPDDPFEIKEEA